MPSLRQIMTRGSRRWQAASGAAIAAGLLTLAACGNAPAPTATPTGSAGPSTPAATQTPGAQAPAATSARIGNQCGMIPASGKDSFSGMSTEDALNAAQNNPQLSAFVAAVRTAALEHTLQGQHSFTLFIPSNTAFGAMSKTDLIKLHNSGQLISTLKYHVVLGQVTPEQVTSGQAARTMQGSDLKLAKSGSTYKVNGATVLCGNIQTADARIYIISKVLWPPK